MRTQQINLKVGSLKRLDVECIISYFVLYDSYLTKIFECFLIFSKLHFTIGSPSIGMCIHIIFFNSTCVTETVRQIDESEKDIHRWHLGDHLFRRIVVPVSCIHRHLKVYVLGLKPGKIGTEMIFLYYRFSAKASFQEGRGKIWNARYSTST